MNIIDFDMRGLEPLNLNSYVSSPDCVSKVRSLLFSKLTQRPSCFQLSFGNDFAEFESFLNALEKFNMFNNLFITATGKHKVRLDDKIMEVLLNRIHEHSDLPFIYYLPSLWYYNESDFSDYYGLGKHIPNEKYGKDSDKMKLLPEEYRNQLPIGKVKSTLAFIYVPSKCNDLIYKNYLKANSNGYNLCRFMKATFYPMKLLPLLLGVTYEDSGFSKQK